MNQNIKHTDFCCALILLAIIFSGAFLMYKDYSRNLNRIKLEEQALINLETKFNLAKINLDQVTSRFVKKKIEFQELNRKIPVRPGIGDLLKQLHKHVKLRNITLIDFNHKPGIKIENHKQILTQLIAKGAYPDIYRFVHDLETLDRIFLIEEMTIQKTADPKICQAKLTASVFQQ